MKRLSTLITSLLFIVSAQAQHWEFGDKLAAPVRTTGDNYGYSVAIDGNYAVVGAWGEDHDVNETTYIAGSGSAYIYKRQSDSSWALLHKITSPNRAGDDWFGFSVDIDGDFIVVSATKEDEDENEMNTLKDAGAVYVFKRDIAKDSFFFEKKLVASDRQFEANYGWRVKIYANVIAVSTRDYDYDKGTANEISRCGAAYIYEFTGSIYTELDKLLADDKAENDLFGSDIALYGNSLAIGSLSDSDENGMNSVNSSGAVYIYKRQFDNSWKKTQKVVSPDRQVSEYFGTAVALNNKYLAIGASSNNTDANGNNVLLSAGAVFIFELEDSTWTAKQKLTASKRSQSSLFGFSVALDRDILAVGTPYDRYDAQGNVTALVAGTVQVFKRNLGGNWQLKKVFDNPTNRGSNHEFGYSVDIDKRRLIIGEDREDDDTIPVSMAGAAHIYEGYCSNSSATIDAFGCNGKYVSPSGNFTWNVNGTYNDVIPNAAGCDSFLTINLTLVNPTTSTINPIACKSYTSPSGKFVWDVTGNYKDTITNSKGCDSIITINLTIKNVDKTVHNEGAMLTSNQSDATYQWIDCADDSPVPAANGQLFVAPENRDYAVIVTFDGCTDTSDCVSITRAGVGTLFDDVSVEVYPNPSQGQISIEFNKSIKNANITITDATGRQVAAYNNFSGDKLTIDLPQEDGVYFIIIEVGGKLGAKRVIRYTK